MTTVDFRTRLEGDIVLLDLPGFAEDRIPSCLGARGPRAGWPRRSSVSHRSRWTSRDDS